MMVNSTQVSYFILSTYYEFGRVKYFVFIFILCVYIFAVFANLLLIVIIRMNKILCEPMYLFLCSLFANELFGSTSLYPMMLLQLLTDIHTISPPLCYLQIFCLYTYGNILFCNLAALSYDRYMAICFPLQYTTHMTHKKIALLIVASWLFPFTVNSVTTGMNVALHKCRNVIVGMYCNNYIVVRLACSSIVMNNIYGLVYTFSVPVVLAALIFYTYCKIIAMCLSGCKQTRQKALSTCTPHLASLFNFCFGCFLEIAQSRFDMSAVPLAVRLFQSLYFLMAQPIMNPLVYGLNLTKVRIVIKRLILRQSHS